ncbi:uncharacterized protein LOC123215304 isoform X2 [Mangifera indica]|uniref:uncharacterized protein LOC123215304 isoform X2 n=1 Tax=Mangifera indica TaxID=29780 RepID=UPI001CFC2066|nr:uncharacterized protein LOC123215304 isoform X2 [Mangifera indica]
MGRRQIGLKFGRFAPLILFFLGGLSCFMVYLWIFATYDSSFSESGGKGEEEIKCCRGIQELEFWGDAVKWGSKFKVNTSEECCMACKDMCRGVDGPCPCNSWVFCGDKQGCGPRFGECWLKKQNDVLEPERRDSVPPVIWTSGLVFGEGVGIVGLQTEYGTLRVKVANFIVQKAEEPVGIQKEITLQMLHLARHMLYFKEHWKLMVPHLRKFRQSSAIP